MTPCYTWSLNFHFSPEGLSVAEKTIEKFLARAVRLYEQEQGGADRLPLAWTLREEVGQVGKRHCSRKCTSRVEHEVWFTQPSHWTQRKLMSPLAIIDPSLALKGLFVGLSAATIMVMKFKTS